MKKRIIFLLSMLLFLLLFVVVSQSLGWDGLSYNVTQQGNNADVRGFAVRVFPGDNCVGYRFSVVDKSGTSKGLDIIDVFRDTYYGNYSYLNDFKFSIKRNKTQMIAFQNGEFSTIKSTSSCYKESSFSFSTSLPLPSDMNTWQDNSNNINAILKKIGIMGIVHLNYGDKVLVEPLYEVMLEGDYHALTTTEIAIYGKFFLGENSDGGVSSTAATWGFISEVTNKIYPNMLFTPDGQGLWPSASKLTLRTTFKNIINKGYGVGIAYVEENGNYSPSLQVERVQVWKGNVGDKTHKFGESIGYSFFLYELNEDYPKVGDKLFYTIYFPSDEQNVRVRQTVWVDGVKVASREVMSKEYEWMNFVGSSSTVTNEKFITVEGRADYIDSSGNVIKYGVKEQFYIPVKPTTINYSVSAYNTLGERQAYSGSTGSDSSVYMGQKIYLKYNYTTQDNFSSKSNFYAAAMYYQNGWKRYAGNGNVDGISEGTYISYNEPVELASSIGYFVVPDNTSSGKSVINVVMTNQWCMNEDFVYNTNYYEIPVVKSDVELSDIRFVNSNGYYVSSNSLITGESYSVRYVYKNNTSCKVFVNGYGNDGKLINTSGVFAIDENSSIEVDGGSIIAGSTDKIWGGVYLSTVEKGDTHYESNGTNNEMTKDLNQMQALDITEIIPCNPYREKTEVITSYIISNLTDVNITPTNNLRVEFKASDAYNNYFYTEIKSAVVPKQDSNIIYFKYKVPENVSGTIKCVATMYIGDSKIKETVYLFPSITYETSITPNTQYEKDASNLDIKTKAPNESNKKAVWSEYTYENGKFVNHKYSVTFTSGYANIQPTTGSTWKKMNDSYEMKSGYGYILKTNKDILGGEEFTSSNKEKITGIQYAYATFPEFGYSTSTSKYTTLNKYSSYWTFPKATYGFYHYTPLAYPDGDYTVQVTYSDLWTPVGMISSTVNSNTITINGSMYDDWYIR